MTISYYANMMALALITTMMIIVISSILMNFIHPLMLILLLVVYTFMNLLVMYFLTSLSMYMYMIFISIVGGMMVMFLYFTSMINNHPSKIKLNEVFMLVYLVIVSVSMVSIYMDHPIQTEFINAGPTSAVHIYKIYLYPWSLMTIVTIVNLLYCLALTIKMCSSKYSPLRKINYEKI